MIYLLVSLLANFIECLWPLIWSFYTQTKRKNVSHSGDEPDTNSRIDHFCTCVLYFTVSTISSSMVVARNLAVVLGSLQYYRRPKCLVCFSFIAVVSEWTTRMCVGFQTVYKNNGLDVHYFSIDCLKRTDRYYSPITPTPKRKRPLRPIIAVSIYTRFYTNGTVFQLKI